MEIQRRVERGYAKLRSVFEELKSIFEDIRDNMYQTAEKAFDNASEKVGYYPPLPRVILPTLSLTSTSALRDLTKIDEKTVPSYAYHKLIELVDELSFDQGYNMAFSDIIPVADPIVFLKHAPRLVTSLDEIRLILSKLNRKIQTALYLCRVHMKYSDEYFSCLADEISEIMPEIRRLKDEIDYERIEQELEEVYKAILEHGKERIKEYRRK